MMILCGPKLITWSVLLLLCICKFWMAKTQVGFIPINRCIDIAWTIAASRTHIPIAYRFDVWFAIENFGTFASNVSFTYIATMIYTWIQFAHQNEQWISLIQCPSVFLSSEKYGSEMLQNQQTIEVSDTHAIPVRITVVWGKQVIGIESIDGQD